MSCYKVLLILYLKILKVWWGYVSRHFGYSASRQASDFT